MYQISITNSIKLTLLCVLAEKKINRACRGLWLKSSIFGPSSVPRGYCVLCKHQKAYYLYMWISVSTTVANAWRQWHKMLTDIYVVLIFALVIQKHTRRSGLYHKTHKSRYDDVMSSSCRLPRDLRAGRHVGEANDGCGSRWMWRQQGSVDIAVCQRGLVGGRL